MAKLLEALKAQGVDITEAVEVELLKEFTEKKELDLKEVEVKELKEQIVKRDSDMEELKKANPEELKTKLEDLEKKYVDDTKNLEKNLNDAKLDGALKLELSQSKAKDIDILAGLINKENLKIKDDGKLDGLSEQLEKIKTEKAFLFNEAAEPPAPYVYKPGASTIGSANENISIKEGVADALGL